MWYIELKRTTNQSTNFFNSTPLVFVLLQIKKCISYPAGQFIRWVTQQNTLPFLLFFFRVNCYWTDQVFISYKIAQQLFTTDQKPLGLLFHYKNSPNLSKETAHRELRSKTYTKEGTFTGVSLLNCRLRCLFWDSLF